VYYKNTISWYCTFVVVRLSIAYGVHVTFMVTVVIICCADVEEMNDSLQCLMTADSSDHDAVGDGDSQRTNSITLSVNEYASLTSKLAAAEEAARQTAEQLQQALSDLEKMRLLLSFSYVNCWRFSNVHNPKTDIRLMASFPGNLGKLAPERLHQSGF